VAWCSYVSNRIIGKYPELPEEISDRDADCWESLLAVADAAGGAWPALAREAAVHLVRRGKDQAKTAGVELLQHIREAFGEEESLWTTELLAHLVARDESPWKDIRGKELNDRGLASRLKPYTIKSKDVWRHGQNKKGYAKSDFKDAWKRYLPQEALEGLEGLGNCKQKQNSSVTSAPSAQVAADAPHRGRDSFPHL
jgi:hypothetical protein